ncbi:MAG: fimbria major subunit [Bacteroides sp.]|nr:fimbria major subunit [Bacteroides sp.]
MKTPKSFMALFMAVAMTGFTSCSDDNVIDQGSSSGNPTISVGDGFYMSLTVKMPTPGGSRSSTVSPGQSNDGNEVGSEVENYVGNVLIVVARRSDNGFIVAGRATGNTYITPIPTENSYKTVTKLQRTNLNDYYSADDFDQYVNIFVFCNPTSDLTNYILGTDDTVGLQLGNTEWLNYTCSVREGGNGTPVNTGIWGNNSFLMNNVSIATRKLPKTIGEWESYKTAATAFDFSGINNAGQDTEVDNSATNGRGAVKVQRSVARLDFKDGSPLSTPANTYDVVKNRDQKTIVQVELNRILLANMANSFYYLPRTSANGQLANATICGNETRTNYVVGPYATRFSGNIASGFSNYFNYSFFTIDPTDNSIDYNNDAWANYLIKDVLKGTGDLYEGPDAEGNTHTPGDYKVWRYVTENVIPGAPVNQRNGISTGIIFKGRFVPTQECANGNDEHMKDFYDKVTNGGLTGNPNTDPILYSLNGSLYYTWPNVVESAIANSIDYNIKADGTIDVTNINRSEPLYVAVYGSGGMGTITIRDNDGKEYSYTDELAESTDCADYKWNEWHRTTATQNNPTLFKAMQEAITGSGFTIYQSSIDEVDGPGYYCYYFYWNRHNDNNLSGTMGVMEFATVRNNVYKLAVTNIKQLGHPRVPGNDPDSPTPNTPDETDDIYLTVTCNVVPWVVRLNNIEF